MPSTGLLLDTAGNLFGTAHNALYELSRAGKWHQTVLYSFCSLANCTDGRVPMSGLTRDASGAFFGSTVFGGGGSVCQDSAGCGVLFKLENNDEESVLYNFCSKALCADGSYPQGGYLALDDHGDLWGTTSHGGENDNDENGMGGGTIFRMSGAALETVYSFCAKAGCADGEYPYSGVIMDPSGNLYGTTYGGGANGGGTVFELSP
jgi:uncharacterized repeat protein (TIGR03803 family)